MGVEIFLAGSALTPAPDGEGGDTGGEEEEAEHGHHHRYQAGTLASPPEHTLESPERGGGSRDSWGRL